MNFINCIGNFTGWEDVLHSVEGDDTQDGFDYDCSISHVENFSVPTNQFMYSINNVLQITVRRPRVEHWKVKILSKVIFGWYAKNNRTLVSSDKITI